MRATARENHRRITDMGQHWFGYGFSNWFYRSCPNRIQSPDIPDMSKTESFVISSLVGLAVVPLVWFLFYKFMPVDIPMKWDGENYIIPSHVEAGQYVTVHREFTIDSPTHAIIDRKLIKTNDKTTTVVSLPQAAVFYNAGKYYQDREFLIPCTVVPGKWSLANTVIWDDYLGRTQRIYPPVLTVTVTKGC